MWKLEICFPLKVKKLCLNKRKINISETMTTTNDILVMNTKWITLFLSFYFYYISLYLYCTNSWIIDWFPSRCLSLNWQRLNIKVGEGVEDKMSYLETNNLFIFNKLPYLYYLALETQESSSLEYTLLFPPSWPRLIQRGMPHQRMDVVQANEAAGKPMRSWPWMDEEPSILDQLS